MADGDVNLGDRHLRHGKPDDTLLFRDVEGRLTARELSKLVGRLLVLGEPRPLVVCVYKMAKAMAAALHEAGFRTFHRPGPYATREEVAAKMPELSKVLPK